MVKSTADTLPRSTKSAVFPVFSSQKELKRYTHMDAPTSILFNKNLSSNFYNLDRNFYYSLLKQN